MKKVIYILLALAVFSSCQKADKNGDLDGFWKLLQIEEFESGTITNTKEVDRFWSVQLDLMTTTGNGKGRFQHIGDSLFVQMINVPPKPIILSRICCLKPTMIHIETNITNVPTATPHWAIATAGRDILRPPFRVLYSRCARNSSMFIPKHSEFTEIELYIF